MPATQARGAKGYLQRGATVLDPASCATGVTSQEVTVKHRGSKNNVVVGHFLTALDAGLELNSIRIKDKSTFILDFNNSSGSPIDPASNTLIWIIL